MNKWNGATWSGLSGTPQGGVALAVTPGGTPWIINDQDKIFRRNGGQWEQIPGRATVISIAPNGAVFVLGNVSHNLFKWNGTSWTPQTGTGGRLSVAALERPWIVNEQGEISRRGYLHGKLNLPSL